MAKDVMFRIKAHAVSPSMYQGETHPRENFGSEYHFEQLLKQGAIEPVLVDVGTGTVHDLESVQDRELSREQRKLKLQQEMLAIQREEEFEASRPSEIMDKDGNPIKDTVLTGRFTSGRDAHREVSMRQEIEDADEIHTGQPPADTDGSNESEEDEVPEEPDTASSTEEEQEEEGEESIPTAAEVAAALKKKKA